MLKMELRWDRNRFLRAKERLEKLKKISDPENFMARVEKGIGGVKGIEVKKAGDSGLLVSMQVKDPTKRRTRLDTRTNRQKRIDGLRRTISRTMTEGVLKDIEKVWSK